MNYDVFISCASQDKEIAKEVKQHLDVKGLKCWFDSESTHDKETIKGVIETSKILLVLVSSEANKSYNIPAEIILADIEGLTILPVRIQNVTIQGLLKHLLVDSQWLEAVDDEINFKLDLITEALQSLKSNILREETQTVHASARLIKCQKLERLPLEITEDCTLEELKLLSDIIPERTVSLWKLGIKVHEALLHKCQDSDKAHFLIKLAIHRHRGNSRNKEALGQALSETNEATTLLRTELIKSPSKELYAALSKSHREAGWILDDLRFASRDPGLLTRSCQQDILGALAATGQYPSEPESIKGEASEVNTVLNSTPLEDTQCIIEYANCLNNLTIRLRSQNNASLALKVIERAVDYGRKLAAANWPLYAADLARYLNNLAQCQVDLNETDQALQNVTESIKIRREFYARRPDELAQSFILSLGTKRSLLLQKKDLMGAYQTIEEIIRVLIDLSAKDPANFCPQITYKCHDIGYLCFHTKDDEKGLEYLQKGLAAFKSLIPSDQDIYFDELLRMYHNAVYFCQELKQYPEAVSYLEELYDCLLEKQKQHPDLHLQDLIRTARKLSYYSALMGNSESAEKWKSLYYDYAAECEDLDHTRIGMYEHVRSESLKENLNTEEAIEAMLIAVRFFRKALEKCNPEKDVFEFAMRSGDLSSALVHLGSWQDDLTLLKEAEMITRKALDCFDPKSGNEMYTYGALCHNLGHALYRHGEIEQNLSLVREGITFLEKSIDAFQNPPEGESWEKPAKETQKIIDQASAVKEKLASVDFI